VAKILSLTIYTNGLFGQPFAIGAVVYNNDISDNYEEIHFEARCPIRGKIDVHTQQDILTKIKEIKLTHSSYRKMLASFAQFYFDYSIKHNAITLIYKNYIGLARVLTDMHIMRYINYSCDLPNELINLENVFQAKGYGIYTTTTPIAYNALNGVSVLNFDHHKLSPLYVSRANALCFMHIKKI
jgi:hypothetical protein